MSEASRVLFDACTLENFAAVGRIDLLQELYSGRCGWTDGVERDVRRGCTDRPHLQQLIGASWLGEPISDSDPLHVQQIDRMRRAFGGSAGLPTQHLGEAQTIHHIVNNKPTCYFATDDRDAYETARRRGIRVIDTPEILSICYERHLLGCPEAYELLQKMASEGRGVSIPASHWHICP